MPSDDADIKARIKKRLRDRAPFRSEPEQDPSPFRVTDPAVDAMSKQVENLSDPNSYQTDAQKREFLYRRMGDNPSTKFLKKAPTARKAPLQPAEPDPEPDMPLRWKA